MSLDEAITIVEAHLTHQWDSLYLMDAWEKIKNNLKEENNESL